MTDVFISYKREDFERVKPLAQGLAEDGLAVWWDEQIPGGAGWRRAIEDALNSARCVLVVWSERSVGPEGEFVHDEASHAKRRGVYLPVRIDAVQPPIGFGQIQAMPLLRWRGDRSDPGYLKIVDAVRGVVSGEHRASAGAAPRAIRSRPTSPRPWRTTCSRG